MKLYTFNFPGLALGGVVKIIAGNEAAARRLAIKEIVNDKSFYSAIPDEQIELVFVQDAPPRAFVVHYDNGDY